MTMPFATKWDFLFGTVLIGVDQHDGSFFATTDARGTTLICVWASDERARAAIPGERFAINAIKVADLLGMLPGELGIVVDPDHSDSLVIDPPYAAQLRPLTQPFPAGHAVEFKPWVDLPGATRDAIAAEMRDRPYVEEVLAFRYTIDDSPSLGLLAARTSAGPEGHDGALNGLGAALARAASLASLDVAKVQLLSVRDVPADVVAELGERSTLYRRG